MASVSEVPVALRREVAAPKPEIALPIKEGRVFHFLRKIRTLDNIYPFNLRGQRYLKSRWKRSMDLSLGLVALTLTSPAIAIGAAATKLESPGLPVFIRQERHVRKGQVVGMLKIRSMRNNLEATGEIRPTRVGRALRLTSIDELPQLANVIAGEMSLVGKRPVLEVYLENLHENMEAHLPFERAKRRFGFTKEEWRDGVLPAEQRQRIEEYADEVRVKTLQHWERFMAEGEGKPGITGLYQVLGRRDVADHHRVRLDNFYEQHASLGLDLTILIATLPAVLSRRGAF